MSAVTPCETRPGSSVGENVEKDLVGEEAAGDAARNPKAPFDVDHNVLRLRLEGRSWFYRKFVGTILHQNDRPEAIARGVSLGMVIAMTPTVGFQMLMVLVIHTLCRANRIAGIVTVYISNPLTIVPIYWLDYVVGSVILRTPMYGYETFKVKIEEIFTLAKNMYLWDATLACLQVGGDLFVPMFLGGTILGVIAAIPLYPITLKAVRTHQARRALKKGAHDAS